MNNPIVDYAAIENLFNKALTSKVEELLSLKKANRLNFKEIQSIGSFARGQATAKSDIDLLVILDKDPTHKGKILFSSLCDYDGYPKIEVLSRTKEF